MAIPVIKRQQVNIIMEDGVTPEIIENVRQVVAIASHYDRARGDVISVMTASFKKREKQDAAEAIILKNIAEKIDNLERRQRDAERMAKIEQQKRAERQAVIRDSLRIQELRKQIADLQTQLNAPQISEDQRAQTRALADARVTELANLKEQLRESNRRLQDLEMSALETTPPGFSRINNLGLYIILGLFALALIILLIILLVNRRTHQKRQEMEWGYGTKIPMGPRPQPVPQQPTQQAPVETAPAPAPPTAPPAAPVDTAALKEEMKGIKQSVISMSVGQPDTASRVINEWLGQTKQAEESESEF
jgi:flagellar biosynthesis/type III secretory pathway M-ring protein FliF/YscJ